MSHFLRFDSARSRLMTVLACLATLAPPAVARHNFGAAFYPTTSRLGHDGRFYANFQGSPNIPGGAVVAITPSGGTRILSRFPNLFASPYYLRGGVNPSGIIAVGQDGALYGATNEGGAFGAGTVFKLEMNGRRTTLHHFQRYGYKRQVLAARNGDLYVAAEYETNYLVRLAPDGSSATIDLGHDFLRELCETAAGEIAVGVYRYRGSLDPEGYLYKVDAADQLQPFATFVSTTGRFGNPSPHSLLPQPDGSIIALTDQLVRVLADGSVEVLHQFSTPFEGQGPVQVFVAKDGSLIGETASGGVQNAGTIFRCVPSTGEYTVLEHLPQPGLLGTAPIWLDHFLPFLAEAVDGNRLPSAKADIVADAALRRSTRIDVLKNDDDADGDPMTIISVGTAAHGTVAFDFVKQQIEYTPDSPQPQYDSFSYRIVDGNGGTAEGHVYIRPNRVGRYHGEVTSVPSVEYGDPGTTVGSLKVRVTEQGVLAGSIELFGQRFAFSGAFNERNVFATPLYVNQRLGRTTSIELWLKPVGSEWEVRATVVRNGIPFIATAVAAQ